MVHKMVLNDVQGHQIFHLPTRASRGPSQVIGEGPQTPKSQHTPQARGADMHWSSLLSRSSAGHLKYVINGSCPLPLIGLVQTDSRPTDFHLLCTDTKFTNAEVVSRHLDVNRASLSTLFPNLCILPCGTESLSFQLCPALSMVFQKAVKTSR